MITLAITSSLTSSVSNHSRSSNISNGDKNEGGQLNRINLQALQKCDLNIIKLIDQAQRIYVSKFIAEKLECVDRILLFALVLTCIIIFKKHKDLDGTLFILERCMNFYS